jgi:hypothetical protein
MIIQLGISHQKDATTIVAIVPGPDDVRTVVYTGTHLEGDSSGIIRLDLSDMLIKAYLKGRMDEENALTAEIERLEGLLEDEREK